MVLWGLQKHGWELHEFRKLELDFYYAYVKSAEINPLLFHFPLFICFLSTQESFTYFEQKNEEVTSVSICTTAGVQFFYC